MRIAIGLFCVALASIGCKKGPVTGGGGGGGGGGWLVGSSGLMANVHSDETLGAGYDLGSTEQLNGIACRFLNEAWVVGNNGTLLYTNDAGDTWTAQTAPTTADLRALATQDAGPVYVAGNGTFLESNDTGATWTELGNGTAQFRSIAAAQAGSTVLGLSDDGQVWSYQGGVLVKQAVVSGAHAVAVASDGGIAMLAGAGLWRSTDFGTTWTQLVANPALVFDDVEIATDGSAVAVGENGVIANIDANGIVVAEHVGTANLHTVHVADSNSYDAVGYTAGDGGQILITHDSGWTWEPGPNLGRTVLGVDEIGIGHR